MPLPEAIRPACWWLLVIALDEGIETRLLLQDVGGCRPTQPEERYLNASDRSVTGVGTRSAAVAAPLQIHVLDLAPT